MTSRSSVALALALAFTTRRRRRRRAFSSNGYARADLLNVSPDEARLSPDFGHEFGQKQEEEDVEVAVTLTGQMLMQMLMQKNGFANSSSSDS